MIKIKEPSEIYPEIKIIEMLHFLQDEIFEFGFCVDGICYKTTYSKHEYDIVDSFYIKDKLIHHCVRDDGNYIERIKVRDEWIKR